MVEVEEIKTTISHLSIPLTEPVAVTVTQPSPMLDPDEEIETLIEEDNSETTQANNKIRHVPCPVFINVNKQLSFFRNVNRQVSLLLSKHKQTAVISFKT